MLYKKDIIDTNKNNDRKKTDNNDNNRKDKDNNEGKRDDLGEKTY